MSAAEDFGPFPRVPLPVTREEVRERVAAGLPPVPLRRREAAQITGQTAEAMRELLGHLRDDAPGWAYKKVSEGLPLRRELNHMTPPLFELCWSTNPDDIWDNCDRKAMHDGPCVWAR